ncbi:hypothetical protein CORC01_00634 [Colletotrichum orchidophilum]|uniref:Uncharacterized protein n=1 Tax=Colletotrichum orchidophilum TaxID=1209926 RepID=A0A1G4BSI7_9PEZI|nr:uncharacterized protein CORC01_00634 [Colletotrichum orchidophilum]OHF04295.1 hypothetical protein CORC01_00634 [Colletotrichum orchidophilum]
MWHPSENTAQELPRHHLSSGDLGCVFSGLTRYVTHCSRLTTGEKSPLP